MKTEVTDRMALMLIEHARTHAEDFTILSHSRIVDGELFLEETGHFHVNVAKTLLGTIAKEAMNKHRLGVVAIKDTLYRPGALMSPQNVHEPKLVDERDLLEKGYVPVEAALNYCRAAAENGERAYVEIRQDVLALPLMVL